MLILEKVDFKTKYFVKTIKETFTNQKEDQFIWRYNHRCIHLLTKLKIHEAKFYRTNGKSWECGTPLSVISKQVDKN